MPNLGHIPNEEQSEKPTRRKEDGKSNKNIASMEGYSQVCPNHTPRNTFQCFSLSQTTNLGLSDPGLSDL